MNDRQKLKARIEKQAQRMQKAEREQSTLLSQTVFTGTLGLVLVLPIIAGAYIGLWLDSMTAAYSVRWTVGLIMLGLIIGVFNVYYLIKEHE
ncbi:MAG: ATP synthase protein I [Gammaproteobacteria bacterium]|nr:ATP synthase protein I [Gammaproteobacteria bacterium]